MKQKEEKPTCGIIMPISEIDGCGEAHWSDVLDILSDAIELGGFEGDLVSNADDVGIIHKRIIQNLYDNPIVVCDVSGKNPNVMFELGLRLAFDKPTIIVKDDKTSYSFDTSAIEHLEYPRDMRFNQIVEFKNKLAGKLKATYEKAQNDKDYTTFLKHFGEFKVAKLEKKEVSGEEYIIEELRSIKRMVARFNPYRPSFNRWQELEAMAQLENDKDFNLCLKDKSTDEIVSILSKFESIEGVSDIDVKDVGTHQHIMFDVAAGANLEDILGLVEKYDTRRRRSSAKNRRRPSPPRSDS